MIDQTFDLMSCEFELMPSGHGWYRFTNPLDLTSFEKGDHTMSYNPYYKWVTCFRTGYSKHVVGFLMDYLELPYRDVVKKIQGYTGITVKIPVPIRPKHQIEYPKHFKSIALGDGLFGERARRYMSDRGFDIHQLELQGVGYCDDGDYFGYIIIPYFKNGTLQYFTARSFIGCMPKYKNPKFEDVGVGKNEIFFNEDALNIHKTVYVLEGAIDAMSIGHNAIACSGWSLSRTQTSKLLRSRATDLVFIPDSGFYEKIKQVVGPLIFNKRITVVDTRPFGDGDVNKWGWENIKDHIKIKPLTLKEVL